MCGIAGILRLWPDSSSPPPEISAAIPSAWISAISRQLAHRGPDGHGLFTDRIRRPDGSIADLVLIHQRLAVIDPAGGHQPMILTDRLDPARLSPTTPPPAAADDLLAIVFNGCIYNHRQLRKELLTGGRKFRTDHSDTEAILHAFARWQINFAQHLEGMFALGLWDRPHGRLVLARDRPGEKPLYFTSFLADSTSATPTHCLAFASTVPALITLLRLARPDDPPAINHDALQRWIRFGYDRELPLQDIQSLPAGHIASTTPDLSGWAIQPYFALPSGRDPSRQPNLDDLDRLLYEAVKDRLESDVPLGCFLSGGIDSSLIAAYARRAKSDLRTFCIRMPDPRYDESSHAKMVARRLNTRHTTLEVSPRPAEDLQRLIPQLGLPLGDSSLLPTHWVSAAARKHVTVALSGDGGDELFMGYDRYTAASLLRDYGPMLRAIPSGLFDRFHPRTRLHKLSRLALAARHQGYEELLAIFPTPLFAHLFPKLDPRATSLTPPGTRITDPSLHDFQTYLPDDLLRKVDTASMAIALEVRAPMLATTIIQTALSTPTGVLAPDGPKSLLRMLARRYLPDAITTRRKSGFAIPIGEWFRTDQGGMKAMLNDTLRTAGSLDTLGLNLNPRAITTMLDDHLAARRDHAQRLYTLLVLALWSRWLAAPSA